MVLYLDELDEIDLRLVASDVTVVPSIDEIPRGETRGVGIISSSLPRIREFLTSPYTRNVNQLEINTSGQYLLQMIQILQSASQPRRLLRISAENGALVVALGENESSVGLQQFDSLARGAQVATDASAHFAAEATELMPIDLATDVSALISDYIDLKRRLEEQERSAVNVGRKIVKLETALKKKEEESQKEITNLERKYRALANSRLGRATLAYWRFKGGSRSTRGKR